MIRRRRFGRRTETRLVLSIDHQRIMREAHIIAMAAEMAIAHEKVDTPAEVADALQQIRIQAKELSDPTGLLISDVEDPE